VAVGRLAPASGSGVPPWWRWLEGQLEKQYRAMAAGERGIDGFCLYSGNFSVSRDAFFEAGGFDERLGHCEDIELGLRLQRRGARFVLALQARGEHWGYRDYGSWREMARRYGRWDAMLALDAGHASACQRLVAGYRRRGRALSLLGPLLLRQRRHLEIFVRLLRRSARAAGVLRLGSLERSVYGAIYDLTYWSEVCAAIGGWSDFSRIVGRGR
jgi:GT2 family glycosyltransferase